MSSKWKVIIAIMLLLAATCGIFTYLIFQHHRLDQEQSIRAQTSNIQSIINLTIDQDHQQYLQRVAALVNGQINPGRRPLLESFANQDRAGLLAASLPLFKVLHQENPYVVSMGWILPDNTVLLRAHEPDNFGQDVTQTRPDIVLTNQTLQPNSGFHIGLYSMQFRIVCPVFLDGRHLGAIQVGLDASQILDRLTQRLNTSLFLYIPEGPFSKIKDPEEFLRRSALPAILYQKGAAISLDREHLQKLLAHTDITRDRQEIAFDTFDSILVRTAELKDYAGVTHGAIFTSIDIAEQRAATRRILIVIILVTLTILTLSFFILYLSYGRLIQKIVDLNSSLTDHNLKLEDRVRIRTSKIKQEIEARRSTEKSLRQAKEQWEKTFDAIRDVITIQDTEMRIVMANKAAEQFFKLPQDKLLGRKCYQLLLQRDTPCPDCPIKATHEDHQPHDSVVKYPQLSKTFNISSFPLFDDNGQLQHVVHAAKDITLQTRSEENRIRLSAAIEQASETVVITDRDGVIQYVNPAFEKCTGYSREEVIGRNPSLLKSGHQTERFYKLMWKQISSGHVWSGQLTNRKKDGTLFEEEMTISPVLDASGTITNFVAVKRDVSREIALEKQLSHSMKMEAIGTLAGGIAHDFNNILSVILGYGNMILAGLPPDSPLRDDISKIIEAGNRATDLVRQILTFSRHGEEAFRPIKIQDIVGEAITFLRSSLPSTITITSDIAPDCPPVMANQTQLHQVMMNLSTNAKHAMGGQPGTLTIKLKSLTIEQEGQIEECPALTPGPYLQLSVIDTGAGMDQAQIERIFDPFYTTKEKEKGTGLGLAVVHGIISKHRGEISVHSEPGRGTSFHIYLPVVGSHTPIETDEVKDENLKGTENILLVDDEQIVLDVEQRILSSLGYQVTTCSSPIEALELFQKSPDSWDLVITDMTMPVLAGSAMAQQLLRLRADIPIILCTGFSENIDEKRAYQIGIKGYLTKPFEQLKLATLIRELLSPEPST